MKKIKKFILEKKIMFDVLNVIVGAIMILLIVLFIFFPGNGLILVLLFMAGGLMNISNGMKWYRDKEKRAAGMSQICVGMIIMFLALYFMKMGILTAG